MNKLKTLRHIQLTDTEKTDMRARLLAYADLHEASTHTRSVLSPFSPQLLWRLGAVSMVGVVLLASGVGVSYAAENSLPGQTFYTVKVSLIEPIQGALIPTAAGKAEWENVLADRRLTEASTLAAKNELTASTTAYLETAASNHAAKSEQAADQLAVSGDTSAALQIRSDLEARLSAHEALLSALAPRLAADGDASTTAHVAILLDKVINTEQVTQQARVATEVALLGSNETLHKNKVVAAALFHATTTEENSGSAEVAIATQERITEQNTLFAKHASILMLVAPAVATTSASSTQSTTTTSIPGL